MKTRNDKPVSPEVSEQINRLEARLDEDIDLSDIPSVTDWSNAVKGKFYRPVKKPYSLRLDADVVDWFKAHGEGYQTRINAALREYVRAHQKQV